MKQKRFKLLTSVFLLLAVLLTGCTAEEENVLPDGKYPMTFTAAVDGLTVTRAAGKDMWTANDEIAVSVDGGNGSKTYKITNTSTGAMAPADPNDIYYWKTNTEELNIQACYPAADVTGADISDQSGGFASFDYLTATTTARFTASGAVALSFKHQMAKVTYTLQKDNSISDADFSSATVQIYGYTKATFTKGVLNGETEGWITPHTDKAALVVPQQMQGQKFVKVTIGTGTAAECDYYYTPTGDDANLEAGKQYTYTITVKKTGLEVTVTGKGTSWTDVTVDGSTDPDVTYQITAPATGVTIATTSGGSLADNGSGSYTLSGGNKITITNGVRIGIKGLYAEENGIYTLKSDLLITYALDKVQVGDFYCKTSDGSTGYLIPGDVTSLTDEQKRVCLGVVCWVGSEAYDEDPLLKEKHSGCTHGLVVALQEAGAMYWSESYESVQNWVNAENGNPYKSVVNLQDPNKRCGYSNTLTLIDYNAAMYGSSVGTTDDKYRVLPIDAIQQYAIDHPAPVNSSGWYFPSVMELQYVCWGQGNGSGTSGRDNLNAYISKADGSSFAGDHYWSSTENYDTIYRAWDVDFGNGNVGNLRKNFRAYRVRPLLAF